MAGHLSFLLILTGLTGIHSQMTINKVSVKLGGSISIPCLYSSDYRNHVKYFCKGYYWSSCSYAVKTNTQSRLEKFLISDDKNQGIFTVTIKDLTTKDTDYWCAVEINGKADNRQYFQLSVTTGTPSLFVTHQEIMGFNGGSITIDCYNSINGLVKWCKLGRSCVTRPSGSIDGTKVTINQSVGNVFTVTMSGLKTESSGWYLCGKGDFQMPVHVTVTEKPDTTTTATATAIATTGQPTSPNLCCSAPISRSLIVTLSLLSFIVMVALFIWFMLKKQKQSKAVSSATTMAVEEAIYGNVDYMRETSGQGPSAESDVDVIYRSVGTIKQQNVKRVEAEDKDVIYSTLAQRYQKK